MESLPSLPQEQILLYLDVKDLLACSLVSVSWRAMVNIDYLWQRVCTTQSNRITIDYLQTAPAVVSPKFEEPKLSQSLEPLCDWRVLYMKLQHVKCNWRVSNHHTYNVTDLAFNHYDLKIDNNYLITNVNDNQCEVWNINGPPRKLKTIICALKNARCKSMIHVGDGRLVIVQDTLLQVYTKTKDSQFKLVFRRLFNCPESDSEKIPGSLNIDEWYNEQVKRRPTHLQAYNVGKYFIGLATNGRFDNAFFHVWDTSSGSKVKEQSLIGISPEINDVIYNIKFCLPRNDRDKILVCIHYTSYEVTMDTFYTVLYIYDLLSLTFKKVKTLKPHTPWVYFEDNLILTICHTQVRLSIYDSSSGALLISKCYEEIINPDSVQVHGNYLGFSTGGDLVVLNKTDFDLVFTTAIVKFSSNLFGFDFVFMDWNLVLIAQWDKVNKIEVWSIKEKCLLSTLNITGLMFPCKNSAKFFVWNEMVTTIYMLQFW